MRAGTAYISEFCCSKCWDVGGVVGRRSPPRLVRVGNVALQSGPIVCVKVEEGLKDLVLLLEVLGAASHQSPGNRAGQSGDSHVVAAGVGHHT